MELDYRQAADFVNWLQTEAVASARGDRLQQMSVAPEGRLWLGRIAPEIRVQQSRLGERGERLDPCEAGLRVRPSAVDARDIECDLSLVAWRQLPPPPTPDGPRWEKTEPAHIHIRASSPMTVGQVIASGRAEIEAALSSAGAPGLAAEIHVELEEGKDGLQLAVTVVNVSPDEVPGLDANLYEVVLEVDPGPIEPFYLDNLRDSFRYDRRIAAYGINGGVTKTSEGYFMTADFGVYDRLRPEYWDAERVGAPPELTFERLSNDPVAPLEEFANALQRWNADSWSPSTLAQRAHDEKWDGEMVSYAQAEAERAAVESARISSGLELLRTDGTLRRAFALANRTFAETRAIRHEQWRPFQLGFVLANIASIHPEHREAECNTVDTLWFATGGGKTETYLLFTLTAAFHDRLTGKEEGITSWGRFPLRMLSLQQTQRFADVFAAAEMIRRRENIPGRPFSVGFLVGDQGTPNRIKVDPRPGDRDPNDPTMPGHFQVLIRCPFCTSEDLEMRFDQARWALDHICRAADCPWNGRPLPFRIVDDEIYRWLPTVVVGTLDKAASVAIQAAMRGFYGPPEGRCSVPEHGFTYATRAKSPTGCLFPGCRAQARALSQPRDRYAPSIRMQDELHLLRDSLGSVDAHYEALLDGLQANWGSRAKIIASSATLAGHDRQVEALYRREGRIFPLPGPRAADSFWSTESEKLARRFVGLAPRGVTLEYAKDQLAETILRSIRRAVEEPTAVAAECGVPEAALPGMVWAYGVDVVYGSTLKDVEAAARSFDAQIQLDRVNPATLTGRTPLEEVRTILSRLTTPEADYYDRIHLLAASSMLSHGVDIDRLNVMTILGLPLSTAEFIQTTSRVGRAHPGLVFTLHKIGRERDAAVFRIFPSFVEHLDRLIDPVPITSKSRRILELTFPGIEQARLYGIHEPASLARGLRQLTRPAAVRRAFTQLPVTEPDELAKVTEMLGFTGPLDENLRRDLSEYMRRLFREVNDPASSAEWVSDLFATEPMMSLRDVEEQVDVYSRGGRS